MIECLEHAERLSKKGKSKASIAREMGVAAGTLRVWKSNKKQLDEAGIDSASCASVKLGSKQLQQLLLAQSKAHTSTNLLI